MSEPTEAEDLTIGAAGEDLIAAGRVIRLIALGRRSGRPRSVAVGFIDEPDGSMLVAAGDAGTHWALNLIAEPRCRVVLAGQAIDCRAEELSGPDRARTIRELILKYGSPSESLGAGPAFRLIPDPQSALPFDA